MTERTHVSRPLGFLDRHLTIWTRELERVGR